MLSLVVAARQADSCPCTAAGDDECFPFFPSREGIQVSRVLGAAHNAAAALITGSYAAFLPITR
jgi:hypothetical protein